MWAFLWVFIFGTSDLNNYELRSSRQQAARLQYRVRFKFYTYTITQKVYGNSHLGGWLNDLDAQDRLVRN